MKRRDFLKLIGVAPLAPSVLAAKEPELVMTEIASPEQTAKILNEAELVKIMEGTEFSNHPVLPDEIVVENVQSLVLNTGTDYQYLQINCDAGDSNQNYTVSLYSATDGSFLKRINNFEVIDRGDGMIHISVPEGVL